MENNNMEAPLRKANEGLVIGAVVVLLVAAGGVAASKLAKKEDVMPVAEVRQEMAYRDGTYEATGNYISPGGDESILVKVTIKDGTIADATVTPQATLPNSVTFQSMFVEGYKDMVVGKKIDEASLTKVSGSSLTPQGWNDAIEKIKAQARA